MKTFARPLLFALLAAMAATPAFAQSLAAFEKAEQRLVDAWTAMPITFRTATFVDGAPTGYGMYSARANPVFAPGEPVVVYAEPLGYMWREEANGTFSFGFDVDLELRSQDGEVLAAQESFARVELNSTLRNRELLLNLTLNLDDAEPGDYVLAYITRDIASDKRGTIELPFTIAAAGSSGTSTSAIDFGDDDGRFVRDGECDDPRFEGPGVATGNVDTDRLHDATDCRAAVAAGATLKP